MATIQVYKPPAIQTSTDLSLINTSVTKWRILINPENFFHLPFTLGRDNLYKWAWKSWDTYFISGRNLDIILANNLLEILTMSPITKYSITTFICFILYLDPIYSESLFGNKPFKTRGVQTTLNLHHWCLLIHRSSVSSPIILAPWFEKNYSKLIFNN